MDNIQQSDVHDNLYWYKDAIIYELHIKAFCDGNDDGTGDFAGLLEKLDYLESLGVTAIWVLPFYPSPLRDDGYDIADYCNINPAYGDIAQFKELLKQAHQRNLKVITELVINHTSDQHAWFQRARRAPKGSDERNYYVWTDDPQQYKDVRIIFQDFETSNWSWDPVAEQYYWHRFFHHQPDLNYDNPRVQEEVFKVIDHWCSMGVDGFRLDAVPYLFEREGTNGENLPETHAFLKKLRRYVDDHHPGTVFLAEANMWPEDSAAYFGDGDECHMNYHFPVMPRIFMALRMEDRYPITDIYDQTPEIPESCQWAIFLRNHDELTLEMVTDEERDYMYKVYAKDPKARINLGIRHRLAPLMENNRRKIELLNCLLFSLRGTPVIYYGDEIGMGDNFYLGDRDGVRTPMQWSPDRNAGFSKANPQKLYLPLILDPEYHYESVNVETQLHNPSSLLWFMKRRISMRKKYKAFSRGDLKFIQVDNPKVLAFTRTYEDETMLVIVNLSRYSQPAELDLVTFNGYQPTEVFSKNKFPLIREGHPWLFTLDSHACEWFLLQKQHDQAMEENLFPVAHIAAWSNLVNRQVLEELAANLLPAYLAKTPWYMGKERTINSLEVTAHTEIPMEEGSAFLLLIEVGYESGLPEFYQLPVALIGAQDLQQIMVDYPYALIGKLMVEGTERMLCDATFCRSFQQALLRQMGGTIAPGAAIKATATPALKKYLGEQEEIRSKVVHVLPAYTAVMYDNAYFLKIYRRVEKGVNPDVEMTRLLSAQQLPSIPSLAGTLEWQVDTEPITLALLQDLVEYHGTGATYMKDRLNNFNEKILARDKANLPPVELDGTILEAIAYEALPESLQELLGVPLAEGARMIGAGLAELHKALQSGIEKDFAPENFSLHYQRSLFGGMQTLVRTAFDELAKQVDTLPAEVQEEARQLLQRRQEVLAILKKIHSKKMDVTKTRVHGWFILDQVLFTGKDIAIPYLGGDTSRSFSERRLKRSPLRDVASMIRSFHYAAQAALRNGQVRPEDLPRLQPYYHLWTRYVSGFFLQAYLQTAGNAAFIPATQEDLLTLLRTYLLEMAVHNLHYELSQRPAWVTVPLRLMNILLDGAYLTAADIQ
jgi:maltose alpha-D-glucosyltransferase/alpha-amylase